MKGWGILNTVARWDAPVCQISEEETYDSLSTAREEYVDEDPAGWIGAITESSVVGYDGFRIGEDGYRNGWWEHFFYEAGC